MGGDNVTPDGIAHGAGSEGLPALRGRLDSSPEQFGQTWLISALQLVQNVHSQEQM